MKPAEDVENLLENLNDTTSAEMDERVLGDVMQALAESNETKSVSIKPTIGRTIMKSPIAKLAAAAVVVIALLIAMSQFGGSTGGVAWGEVVRNIEASPGYIFRWRQTHNDEKMGTNEFHFVAYGSAGHGMRLDGYHDGELTTQTYCSLKEGAIVSIMHSLKNYTRTPLSGDQLAEMERFDPKEAVGQVLSSGYRKLGRKTINGVEAEGVEITDPAAVKANFPVDSYTAQLWVALETGLPVLVEAHTVGKNGTLEIHSVQDDFQWNVELDASEFELAIPEDYTQMEVEIDAEGRATFKTTVTHDSQEAAGAEIRKWRFVNKHPERGYTLESEGGQTVTTIPESWADSPEHAVRVKEELDLLKRQGNRELVEVREMEANGQLDFRILMYEYNLSDGQTVRISDFDPDDPSQWTVTGERQEEFGRLLRERRRQEEQGQELATTEEREVHGRVFVFRKWRLVLSDRTKVVYSIGRPKDN